VFGPWQVLGDRARAMGFSPASAGSGEDVSKQGFGAASGTIGDPLSLWKNEGKNRSRG